MQFQSFKDKLLRSRWTVVTSAMVIAASLALLCYEDPRQIHGWPPLGISVRVPGYHMQARATRYTIGVYCQRNKSVNSAGIAVGNRAYLLNPSYHHGLHLEAAGFGFAFLPTTYGGSDYVVFPHIAMGIPFWFTAATSGLLMLYALHSRRRHRNQLRAQR